MEHSVHKGKVSVIIPCYNVERYIDRCMNSIVNQTIGIQNMEIILINDASVDHTYQKLLQWEKEYSEHILLIDFKENRKPGTARNIGIQYATGEYIAFCDADDWIEPTMYEILLSAIESGDYDFAQGGVMIDEKENYLTPEERRAASDFVVNITSPEERKKIILQTVFSCWSYNKLYKKDFLVDNHIVFLENMLHEDVFFLGLLNLYTKNAICVGEYLYHYFHNPDGVSKQRNAAYHFDYLEAGLRRLLEYKGRNIFVEYKDELEYEYLQYTYFLGMRLLIRNVGKIPYDRFLQIQAQVTEAVPDYRKNPYIKQDIKSDIRQDEMTGLILDWNQEVTGLLLDILDKEVPEDVWEEIEKALHAAWDD